MHRSRPLLRLASNKAGMNRILKYRTPIVDYIRLAVNSGTFYDLEGMVRSRQEQRDRMRASYDEDRGDDDDDDEEDEEDEDGNAMFQANANDNNDNDDDDDEDGNKEKTEYDEEAEEAEMLRQADIAAIENELGLKSVLHGTSVMKYPVEYEILSQHPPIPFRPNTPKRFMVPVKPNPMKPLMNRYFINEEKKQQQYQRHQNQQNHTDPTKPYEGPHNTEEYYHRILNIPPPAPILQQKSASMVRAYAVVQKQYELMKTHGLGETQALVQVEELLQQAQTTETFQSRAVRQNVHQWRREQTKLQRAQAAAAAAAARNTATTTTTSKTKGIFTLAMEKQQKQQEQQLNKNKAKKNFDPTATEKAEMEAWKDSAPAILWNQPDVLYAIATWGRRLQAVPYGKWTIGATTAMDHWIARKVLLMSEESWQALLEGDANMTSRGRDLIAVRHSLFPETMMESHRKRQAEEDDGVNDDDSDNDDKEKEVEERPDIRSIEELLATLGGSDFAKEYQKTQAAASSESAASSSSRDDLDDYVGDLTPDKVSRLVNELQDWRAKNVEEPYDEWSKDQKISFEMWLDRYIRWLAPGESSVDRAATRMALLASPPITEEKSKSFWDQLKDETDAQILLDRMLKDGPPPADAKSSDYPPQITSVFWELSYQEQLQRLLDLGTLRPILEEYATEEDRNKFWSKYSHILLEDVELEHLVSDPNGPIPASSLDEATLAEFGILPTECFRVEKVPLGADAETGTPARQKARDLYKAWNWHKASRARFEERLYQLGRMGLQYDRENDDNDNKKKKKKKKKT